MGFPENLSKRQNDLGLTNYKIAKDLGISQTTVANWKDGVSKPRSLYMVALAKVLGCTVDDLMREAE